jgi:hypothetical protein
MITRLKFKPGLKGTKRLQEQFGDALACVRYRYDENKQKQIKTVEIVVSERDWSPPPPKYTSSTIVGLKVGVNENDQQLQIKALGGQWDSNQ